MHTEAMREKLFTIRMTDEERERAERIAKRYGLNVAGVIRMLLKREDDDLERRELGLPESIHGHGQDMISRAIKGTTIKASIKRAARAAKKNAK